MTTAHLANGENFAQACERLLNILVDIGFRPTIDADLEHQRCALSLEGIEVVRLALILGSHVP